jgi:capsular polysaccharide biosynthesis protein
VSEPDPSILRYYLGIVWRWRWLLVAPVVALGVLALTSSLRQAPLYATSSGVLLNHQDQIAASVSGVQTPPEDAGRYAVTQSLVAQSPVLARRVLAAVGRPGAPVKSLLDKTSIAPDADVLQFFVNGRNPAAITRLANVYAREFVRYRRELDTQELEATLASLGSRLQKLTRSGQQHSTLYAQLAARQEQVRLIEALRRSNVYVIRTASRDEAEQLAPRPVRNLSLGLAGGLLIGLLLVAIANAFDRRVHDVRELEEALGAPLLARTPAGHGSEPAASDEAVRLAALLVRAARSAEARTVLVASASGEEQAALTSRLAEAMAALEGDVLVVDADLRTRSLTRRFGLDASPGLSDLVAQRGSSSAAVHEVAVTGGRLRLVPAGGNVARPGALIASEAAGQVLRDLSTQSKWTLIASAPLASAPEAPTLASAVDAVVLLVPTGIQRRTVGELRRILVLANSVTLGFILLAAAPGRRSVRQQGGAVASTTPEAGQETRPIEAQMAVGEV